MGGIAFPSHRTHLSLSEDLSCVSNLYPHGSEYCIFSIDGELGLINPNFEYRNPCLPAGRRNNFEIRMTKFSKPIDFFCLKHFDFEHSDLFGNSNFVLRILGWKDNTPLLIERGINNEFT
jgi:hypothetical protein